MFFCSLIGLSGCAEQTSKEVKVEKEAAKKELKAEKAENPPREEPKQNAEEKPIAVEIKDPDTKEIIKTFVPAEMGYGKENNKYKAEIEKWAHELARGTDKKPGYDKRNTPDRIGENGEVIRGTPRVILEEEELVQRVMKASAKGGDVELPLYVTASGYQAEDVEHLDEVVVASYKTFFNPGVAGRTKNIELSAKAINNVIVGTEDYFSFNTTVGPSDEAHGYQPAEEAINGKLVMGIGGGICQTSSTLFNAVDKLGVEYVEKHHHSVTVGYVPKGRDATVSYGGKDFRFQNTTGAPFLVKAIVGNGTLTVEIRTSKKFEGLLKKNA